MGLNELMRMVTIFVTFCFITDFYLLFFFVDLRKLFLLIMTYSNSIKYTFVNKLKQFSFSPYLIPSDFKTFTAIYIYTYMCIYMYVCMYFFNFLIFCISSVRTLLCVIGYNWKQWFYYQGFYYRRLWVECHI